MALGRIGVFITVMLAIDLLVFERGDREPSAKLAATWSAVWIGLGLAFAGLLWWWAGFEVVQEYLAGYLIEKSLLVDNTLLWALIFGYFGVPREYQHRALFWGIFGALAFRLALIYLGAAALETFHISFYIFGAFLILSGLRLARQDEEAIDPETNPAVNYLRDHLPVTDELHGNRFVVRRDGKRCLTPLFLALVAVETTDVVFAVDSIAAILGVTRKEFVIFTSNAFAVLGMRALYFLLADLAGRIVYLQRALAIIMVYIGLKLALVDVIEVPVWVSLLVIVVILGIATAASLWKRRGQDQE